MEREMGSEVIIKISDNIISPLGLTSSENYEAVAAGKSRLQLYADKFGLPEPFCGSLLDRDRISGLAASEACAGADEYTFFEQLCILSIQKAIAGKDIDVSGEDTIFILSTTKGNVSLLEENPDDARSYLGYSAEKISRHFGNGNTPIAVSNACISGVCAQIAAVRALELGKYRQAVVVGADVLSKFIISGFQSFKALSPEPCRPYDADRKGLNLGEAAGTIILTRMNADRICDSQGVWEYRGSAIHNDANHISGPSRTGEGSYRVLADILEDIDIQEIGFVNTHGTATAYNDEMESIAIHRAGLDDVPVNGFKGYYGHTLGAAGIIETILSMQAIEHGEIPATKGFLRQGTTYPTGVSAKKRATDRHAFIKLLSGFGGSNAGIAYSYRAEDHGESSRITNRTDRMIAKLQSTVDLKPGEVIVDGIKISEAPIAGIYREFIGDYPKFFKMDSLCKLGFVAAELLLKDIPPEQKENLAIVLFNRNGSLITDRNYQHTIRDDNYFPSPALFVYTLANIVTGEIAIRHKIYGESSFYVLKEYDADLMQEIAENAMLTTKASGVLTGWVDYDNDENYEAHLLLIIKS